VKEYNRFWIYGLNAETLKRVLIGDARREGLNPQQLKIIEIAISNKFALESAKSLDQIQRDAINETIEF
jgi:hypothetical protein